MKEVFGVLLKDVSACSELRLMIDFILVLSSTQRCSVYCRRAKTAEFSSLSEKQTDESTFRIVDEQFVNNESKS